MRKEDITADLADELWTWAHIARFVHRSRDRVYTLVKTEGFPTPISCVGDRLWVGQEVRDWLLSSREGAPVVRRGRPRKSPAPVPAAPAKAAKTTLTVGVAKARTSSRG